MKTKNCHWAAALLAGASLVGGVSIAASALASPVDRPASYPSGWRVVFAAATPVPADYAFGSQTTVFKRGSAFPPAAMPLPATSGGIVTSR